MIGAISNRDYAFGIERAKAMEGSFESDMKTVCISVHFVSDELDGGEVISQLALEKIGFEEFEDFQKRVQKLEYEIYPKTIIEVLQSDKF